MTKNDYVKKHLNEILDEVENNETKKFESNGTQTILFCYNWNNQTRRIKKISIVVEFNTKDFDKPIERKPDSYRNFKISSLFVNILTMAKSFISFYFDSDIDVIEIENFTFDNKMDLPNI